MVSVFFIYLGMVTLPMTFLSGTPLDCTIHPMLWNGNTHSTLKMEMNISSDDMVVMTKIEIKVYLARSIGVCSVDSLASFAAMSAA